MERFLVDLYTDGACSGNPGPGGWGYYLICKEPKKLKFESGYNPSTTNNQMELMAVINGLKALKHECDVTIHTDSAYVFNAFTSGWVENWKKNGFVNSKKQPVINKDLFIELDDLLKKYNVTWIKAEAHKDDVFNNLCDELATNEIKKHKKGLNQLD